MREQESNVVGRNIALTFYSGFWGSFSDLTLYSWGSATVCWLVEINLVVGSGVYVGLPLLNYCYFLVIYNFKFDRNF